MTTGIGRHVLAVLAVAGMGGAFAAQAQAQAQSLDRGVLMILQDGELIGREEFGVRRGTASATLAGYTLASTALYPANRPEHTLVTVIELGPDSFPSASRYEHGNGAAFRVAIGIGARRIAIRQATGSGESAREYPARGRPLMLDDSVFVTLTVRPPVAGPSPILSVTGELGQEAEVRHLGPGQTLLAGRNVTLDQVQIRMSSGTVMAFYDDAGRLMKIDWPERRITVLREQ